MPNEQKVRFVKNKAFLHQTMGITYYEVGDYQKAIKYLKESTRIFVSSQNNEARNIISNYLEISRSLKEYEKYPSALIYTDTASLMLDKLRPDDKRTIKLQARLIEFKGLIYMKIGDYQKARELFKKTLQNRITNRGPHHLSTSYPYENIADTYFFEKKYNLSLLHYQKAIQTQQAEFTSDDYHENPNITNNFIPHKVDLLRVLGLKAKALHEKYQEESKDENDLMAALETCQKADTLVHIIRKSMKADGSKFFLIKQSLPIYEQAIETALQLFSLTGNKKYEEQAYYFATANKAVVLWEHLHNMNVLQFSGVPDNMISKEKGLQDQILKLENVIRNSETDKERDSLKNVLFNTNQHYDFFRDTLEDNYPEYVAAKYAHDVHIDIKKLQKVLDAETALVEYFIGESHLYTFVITSSGFKTYQQDLPQGFNQIVRQYRRTLSDIDFIRDSAQVAEQQFLSSSAQLYEWLIGSTAADLATKNIKRLTIVPDGILNFVPFETLLYKSVSTWQDNTGYLLQKYAISYVYSSRLLLDSSEKRDLDKSLENFAGFGLEYDDYTLKYVADLKKDSITNEYLLGGFRNSLSKLPYSDDEVLSIQELLGGDVWTNTAVTKTAFMGAANGYKMLHIASHGFLDWDDPKSSALIFTKNDTEKDNFLRLNDIYGMQLNADLVTLSACNTGYGKLEKGEGMQHFPRAFNYAGVPSVVATLWSISDESTAKLMAFFYENLQAGDPKDIALQKAKISFFSDDDVSSPVTRLPLYWAAPVLLGNRDTIEIDNGVPTYIWWGLGMILFLLGIFWVKKR